MGFSGEGSCAAEAAAEGGGSGGDERSVEEVGMRHGVGAIELGERKCFEGMGVRVFVVKIKRMGFLNASKEGRKEAELPRLNQLYRQCQEIVIKNSTGLLCELCCVGKFIVLIFNFLFICL